MIKRARVVASSLMFFQIDAGLHYGVGGAETSMEPGLRHGEGFTPDLDHIRIRVSSWAKVAPRM